jgi:hypothetical protein
MPRVIDNPLYTFDLATGEFAIEEMVDMGRQLALLVAARQGV